jgi:hypothetical protein
MAPGGDILANKSKDFFRGSYIFDDAFFIIMVPMVATNREHVGLF